MPVCTRHFSATPTGDDTGRLRTNQSVRLLARKAGLNNVRFHDLRHTFASLMLMRGERAKVISEALGHASVAFTMDVYSHIIGGMQEDAMRLLDEVMPAGVSSGAPSRNCREFSPR